VSTSGRSYNETEAQEILRRAAGLQTSGAMSRDEMLRAAAELGITPEAVELAEQQYADAQLEDDLRLRYRAKRRTELGEGFKMFLACSVISFLMLRNSFVSFTHPPYVQNVSDHWLAYVIAFFGIWSLIKNAFLAFNEKSPVWQKGFQDFKASEAKRARKAVKYTNDRVIEEILGATDPRQKLEVIKNLRETTGLGLKESKDAVDDYYTRHPELRQGA
jgi:hypothetical protein